VGPIIGAAPMVIQQPNKTQLVPTSRIQVVELIKSIKFLAVAQHQQKMLP
jgi:hypothetical protein